nr:MAG TPA: hypothetical protein [Bacteriophage sp.]
MNTKRELHFIQFSFSLHNDIIVVTSLWEGV